MDDDLQLIRRTSGVSSSMTRARAASVWSKLSDVIDTGTEVVVNILKSSAKRKNKT